MYLCVSHRAGCTRQLNPTPLMLFTRPRPEQVKVRKFTLKAGMDSGNSAYEYRYSLWLPMTGYLQPVRRTHDQRTRGLPCIYR